VVVLWRLVWSGGALETSGGALETRFRGGVLKQ